MLYNQLLNYQKKAVDKAISQPSLGLFFDQGTGKTYITTGIVEKLIHPKAEFLLVVPLTNLKTSWVYTLSKIPGLAIFTDLESYKVYRDGPKVFLINYEAMKRYKKFLIKTYWTLIAFDESQRLKQRSTVQSTIAKNLKLSDHKLILSGTPIEQSPIDIWAQFRFLCPHVFGPYWKDFEGYYCYKTEFKVEFKKKKLPEFLEKIDPYIIRVTKDEVLDLPPINHYRVPVDLLGEQGKAYNDMLKKRVTSINGEKITSRIKLTQVAKLQQICSGFILKTTVLTPPSINTKGKKIVEVFTLGRAKIRKARSLVNKIQLPVVIFCKYVEEIELISREFKDLKTALLYGKTENRETIINDFQLGKYDLLICQIKTGGVGVNLHRASTVIFYSLPYSFIDYEQAIARVHRYGQEKEVNIYTIYAKNTVDEEIYKALCSKRTISDSVLKNLKGV